MRRIDYVAPSTVADAVELLVKYGNGARMLAGGTDLIVQVREGVRDTSVFVDAKRIAELAALASDGSGGLVLGAAVPCYLVYGDSRIARYAALLDASRIIGGIAIQGRASIGGNLCNAGPAGDTIPALIVHRAVCTIAGPTGRRSIAVEDFCTAPGRTVMGTGELLVSLRLPAPPPNTGAAYLRFIPRDEMDIAVVGAAALVTLKGREISDARIALGAVAPTPLLVDEAAAALIGKPAERKAFERAAEIAQSACRPISDMRGTAEHRRDLVGVLVRRALESAVARAA